MVKRLLAVAGIIAVLLSGVALAQVPDTLWTKTFGIGMSNYGSCVIEDDDAGYVVCGTTGNIGPDSCPDMYLIKTDPGGNPIWERTYGGNLGESGRYVSKTSDGGYVMIGETYSYGHADFEYPDMYLVKVDADGIEQWYRTFDHAYHVDNGNCVKQTADGGYIIAGSMRVNFLDHITLIKTDSLGNEVWRRHFGSWISAAYGVIPTPTAATSSPAAISILSDYGPVASLKSIRWGTSSGYGTIMKVT